MNFNSVALFLTGLTLVTQVQAKNLSQPTSPSSYFQKSPEARQAFVKKVKADGALSDDMKKAYISLVSPDNGFNEGDEVLELIDTETLKWFYGASASEDVGELNPVGQELLGGPEKLFDSAYMGEPNLKRCLRFKLCVHVSLSQQRMTAYSKGKILTYNLVGDPKTHNFAHIKISSARADKFTPTGLFSIGEIADRDRVSRLYQGAPLYWAMQLDGDIFIHGTAHSNYNLLGQPASAGCVRTTEAHAKILNHFMRQVQNKERDIRVVVTPD